MCDQYSCIPQIHLIPQVVYPKWDKIGRKEEYNHNIIPITKRAVILQNNFDILVNNYLQLKVAFFHTGSRRKRRKHWATCCFNGGLVIGQTSIRPAPDGTFAPSRLASLRAERWADRCAYEYSWNRSARSGLALFVLPVSSELNAGSGVVIPPILSPKDELSCKKGQRAAAAREKVKFWMLC